MKLRELAGEYRLSGEACRKRLAELRKELKEVEMGEMDRLRLRRRICILTAMARECSATARYLENYYERREVYAGVAGNRQRNGVSGSAAVYKANRFL